MSHHDQLYRYLFEHNSVRGELVTVSDSYQQILAHQNCPPAVNILLGELLVATSLLTATLKFDGEITVQIQGDGPLKLVAISGNHRQEMRGIAKVESDIPDNSTLHHMLGNGLMVITISPTHGERYQGVVALTGETVAECLEAYFHQSEQLPTKLFIHAGESAGKPIAGGMLLQVLPAPDANKDDFNHLVQLTATIKPQEMFTLPAMEILRRLYHQEEVRLYEPQAVRFQCSCSRQRCIDALMTLSPQEVATMLEQDGSISMHCDYCHHHYLLHDEDMTVGDVNQNSHRPALH